MKITESQLRKIIRQEVGRLVEMPARRAPQGGVYTDPDTMPRGPKVSRSQKIADAPDTFAYQQLMQHAPDKLEQLETEAPEAYEDFLVSLYDMSDPDSGKGGLDGRGFKDLLNRALATADLSRKLGSRGARAKAVDVEQELYDTVADSHNKRIIRNDVQGTSRMMVGDIANPGEKEVLKIIASLPNPAHQDALLRAMVKRRGGDVEELRSYMNYLAGSGD
jgi:hypothetical protein